MIRQSYFFLKEKVSKRTFAQGLRLAVGIRGGI